MTRLRILVLDASIPHLSAIRRAIFSDGHTVETTTRKAEAKGALETRAFDLVVVDFHMPGQDGREVLRFLKSGAMIGAPRFIMYTNDATNGVMAQEYGFHRAFLAKGNLELLKSQLRTVVGEWKLEAVKAT